MALIIVGTGIVFNVIFHVGIKEPPSDALKRWLDEHKKGKQKHKKSDRNESEQNGENMSKTQPRSKGLSSEGRKTLVQAGHVPPKKWKVTKEKREGDVTKSRFCLSLTHYGRGKFV